MPTPPPIRYPLPTLMALVLAGLLVWRGEVWSRSWRAEVAARVARAVDGPPVPRSSHPQVIAGPILRRGLLLHDATPVGDQPRGPTSGTIDRRMFVNIYDLWPDADQPTHVRVGNRSPLGWIKSEDLLEWSTRLVVRPPSGRLLLDGKTEVTVGSTACPVLRWRSDAVEVAIWDSNKPWEVVAQRDWVRFADLPDDAWGVWISQVELPVLVRLAIEDNPDVVRLRAVLGLIAGGGSISPNDLATARAALPDRVFASRSNQPGSVDRLAEANAQVRTDARWSGLAFRFLPLADLP